MTYNSAIQCHPEEYEFPFESGSSQGLFFITAHEVFSLLLSVMACSLVIYIST